MSRARWFDIVALAVSMATICGLVFALRPQETATIPRNTATDAATATVARPEPQDPKRPTVLMISDSYSAGSGLPELTFGCMAAVRMGWFCDVSAFPGTGYISGGPSSRFVINPYMGPSTSFVERIPKLAPVYRPDVVVFDGGRNDLSPPRIDVFNAMVATIGEARRAWPAATIVVIRPRFLSRPADDLGFDDTFFTQFLAARHVIILDPIKEFTGVDTSTMMSHDDIHPNQHGQEALASALVDSYLNHGFAVAT